MARKQANVKDVFKKKKKNLSGEEHVRKEREVLIAPDQHNDSLEG